MSAGPGTVDLRSTYLRLRADASVEQLPVDERFWTRLSAGELGRFQDEHLVTVHDMDGGWGVWERHPAGDELVCLLAGSMTLVLELESGEHRLALDTCGQAAVVPRGVWHTAVDVRGARVLFLTPGEGTEHRPCEAA